MKKQILELREEVNNNLDVYEKIQQKVEDILESHYDALYDFFLNIVRGSYDYIILMSRRCLVLYQLFMLFFIMDEEDIESDAVILSDKALAYYLNKFRREDKVVIVDDVIIHGRTVGDIFQLLSSFCEDIQIRAYMAYRHRDCISEVVKKHEKPELEVSEKEWRELSNKLVRCIVESNLPYTSFVTSYFQYSELTVLDKIEKICVEKKVLEKYSLTTQINENPQIGIYFENNEKRASVYEKLSLAECIRVYWNDDLKRLTIIPYVFLKTIKIQQMDTVFEDLANRIPANCVSIKEIFTRKEKDKEKQNILYEFKMRLLTCLLSNLFWNEFKKRHCIDDSIYVDKDTLFKSFGDGIAEEILEIEKEETNQLVNFNINIEEGKRNNSNIIVYLKDILSEKNKSKSENEKEPESLSNIIKKYCSAAWWQDETEAKQKQSRKTGVLVDDFIYAGMEAKRNQGELLAELIKVWDIGSAAANFKVNEEEGIIGGYITSGEQSYKYLLERNPLVMTTLLIASNMITKGQAQSNQKTYYEYKIEKLIEILFEMKGLCEGNDFETISEIIKENQGYLEGWNQKEVLKNIGWNIENHMQKIQEVISGKL